MARREKGWATRTRPSRCRAAHYTNMRSGGTRSLCDRSPIRLVEGELGTLPRPIAQRFRKMEVCDHCQAAARAERKARR